MFPVYFTLSISVCDEFRDSHHNLHIVLEQLQSASAEFGGYGDCPEISIEKLAVGSLPEKKVLRLGVQLAEGLSAAHEHGVVHCDLKPGDLRLTADGR